jgi:hypothetical protein
MSNKIINTQKLYTIWGNGRNKIYKITSVDKVENKAYLIGINNKDAGYQPIEKLRVLSPKHAANYIKAAKEIIQEIQKRYDLIL